MEHSDPYAKLFSYGPPTGTPTTYCEPVPNGCHCPRHKSKGFNGRQREFFVYQRSSFGTAVSETRCHFYQSLVLHGQEIAEDERQHSEPLDTAPLPQTLYLGVNATGIPRWPRN